MRAARIGSEEKTEECHAAPHVDEGVRAGEFFGLIRSEYAKMRSPLFRFASLRVVRTVRLFGTEMTLAESNPSATTRRERESLRGSSLPQRRVDDHYRHLQLLKLFRNPKKKQAVTEYLDAIPSNPRLDWGNEEGERENGYIVELVEGWSASRLLMGVLGVILLAITVTVLWITIGVGSGHGERTESDADARVQAGALLGVLALLVGWTTVGAWALLSWLVGL